MNSKIGEIHKTNEGYEFEIIEYINSSQVIIKLVSDVHNFVKTTQYATLKNGEIKNPFHKSVYNVGFIGVGNYVAKVNRKNTPYYNIWKTMIQRCYDKKFQQKYPTYKDCTVCEEWHNFQNFAKWYEENYYEVDGEQMHLDKDIIVKGNKVYSPETCIFVPERINYLFLKSNSSRGNLPIGVCKNGNKYVSFLKGYEQVKNGYLGMFNTIEEAFCIYKKTKEEYIRQIANEYKTKIPKKLYELLIKYKVEITD